LSLLTLELVIPCGLAAVLSYFPPPYLAPPPSHRSDNPTFTSPYLKGRKGGVTILIQRERGVMNPEVQGVGMSVDPGTTVG
jgi:hypothetical protein